MNDQHDAEAAELGDRLREATDVLGPGRPPVLAVMRQGSRIRRRRRLMVTTVFAATLLVPWAATSFPGLARGPVAAQDGEAVNGPAAVRVVQPYEGVEVGSHPEFSIRLWGPDQQRSEDRGYTINYTGVFDPDITKSPVYPLVRSDGSVNRLNASRTVIGDEIIVSGTWRTATGKPPSSISVTQSGRTYDARLLRLPETPDWGVYYAVVNRYPPSASAASRKPVPIPEDLLVQMLDGNGHVMKRIQDAESPRMPVVDRSP
ncbi:hypothetical protein ACFWFF_13315 [Streptomyces sp. NPDC060223]|uniref:hypothetical protein n=1 Tax=unclassified Streptomyces TaxID=2593676 RepID=UPI003641EB1F